MKKILLITFLFFWVLGKTQNGTFITLSSTGQLAKITIDATGCNSTNIDFCNGTIGSPLSIALNGNILYVVDNSGYLYSTILNTASTCTNLGQFLSASRRTFGLTVDKYGKVYAANGTQIETYDATQPAGNQFAIIGNVPQRYSIGGDLLFYEGQLFMACSNNALLAIDTLNPSNSKPYLTFTSPNVFGFASVIVPCGNNQSYALSTQGSTTDIVGVDMQNKTETGIICSLNFRINDAASVAETQSAIPTITKTLNLDSCNQVTYLNKIYTTNTILRDTTKSKLGCDSIYKIVSINVTLNIAVYKTLNINSCKSVTYTKNNVDSLYQINTIILDTIKSKKGCGDSIYLTVNIIIKPIITKAVFATISSCKPFVYKHLGKDSIFSTSTVITDTIRNNLGCDSIYSTANIIIKPLLTTTTNNNLFNCNSIIFKNKTYLISTNIIDTIRNITGCDSVYNNIKITISPIPKSSEIILADCDSVVYKNIVYTTNKTFLDTLKTTLNNCDSVYKTTNIIIYPKPEIAANTALYTLFNTQILLNPTIANGFLYSWTPKIYLDDSTAAEPFCTPKKDITYKIVVTSQNGCKDSSYQTVLIAKAINIPNVFSPNGDNINDTWAIEGLQLYPHHKIFIYNRFGQLVFTSLTGNYQPWDGKLNGAILPVGVYFYIINLNKNTVSISGSISILK